VSCSAENVAFEWREGPPVLVGVNQLIALFRRKAAHLADSPIEGLAPVWRQLLEVLKDLLRPLLLVRSQVLPGLHAIEHALLLLGRQAGKMLQPLQQPGLLLRRKLSELRIVFEGAALLRGRQILIAAKPVSGVARLILWRTFIRTTVIGTAGVRPSVRKVMPLPVRLWRLRMLRWRWLRITDLGERGRQQRKGYQRARNYSVAQHLVPIRYCRFANLLYSPTPLPRRGKRL
jgi:hypothetical protein